MSEVWALLRQPRLSTTLALATVVAVGLALLGLGWSGTAATLLVPYQVPYLVSGTVLGLAVIGVGLGLLTVHLDRVEAAQERQQLAEFQREALRLLAAASAR